MMNVFHPSLHRSGFAVPVSPRDAGADADIRVRSRLAMSWSRNAETRRLEARWMLRPQDSRENRDGSPAHSAEDDWMQSPASLRLKRRRA